MALSPTQTRSSLVEVMSRELGVSEPVDYWPVEGSWSSLPPPPRVYYPTPLLAELMAYFAQLREDQQRAFLAWLRAMKQPHGAPMPATKEEIRGWFERAKHVGASHMLVLCDTLDHEDFPVFVWPDQDVRVLLEVAERNPGQRVMEVYSMRVDMERQLAEHRAWFPGT